VVESGLALVVVPTVALALDQEQALNGILPYPLAYQGGADPNSSTIRQTIRENVKAGKQRVIFTSPENVIGSLFSVLKSAATNGQLTHFVVDEAHMVYEWGNDFRSSFQSMVGVWQTFHKASCGKLKTILLSATYTATSKQLLESLFSMDNEFAFWSSLKLREEPSFWVKECDDVSEQKTRLLEVLCNAPRPMIVYTTKVAHANDVYDFIRTFGYTRVGLLTGATNTEGRRCLVSSWRADEIDVMVGTSAFGLGIDKSDVRTVLHLCVPETADRFYQEVGRGGRDGKACLSFLFYTRENLRDAEVLSRQTIITAEKGWSRWRKMFDSAKRLENKLIIDLSVRPDIDLEYGDYNENWNLKTLLLMVQARLIRLSQAQPVDNLEGEYNHQKSQSNIAVQAIDHNYVEESYWKNKIQLVRSSIREQSVLGINTMLAILRGKECTGEILQKFYELEISPVAVACGGCPSCRANNIPIRQNILPSSLRSWSKYYWEFYGELKKLFDNSRNIYIEYPDYWETEKEGMDNVFKFISWATSRGIQSVVVEDHSRETILEKLVKSKSTLFV
ncbi:MAG: ATP-dependent DNA helicase RecQ, partial [Sphingobacteriales bacterium]